MNVKQRLRAENAAQLCRYSTKCSRVAQLRKKCDFANFTLIFSLKLNNVDKTNKSHVSSACFRNVAFQSARCINMRSMKNNENE